MFVPQPRPSRQNIHRERVVPEDVKPTQQSLVKLKRLARYLKRERQWGQMFKYGKTVEEVTTFTDSDWAGCKETRKSSSAGVVMLGEHALKAYTRKQKIIVRMQRQSCIGSIGSVRIDRNRVVAERPGVRVLAMKATEHILHRQGIGKLKHKDVAYLWIQDEVRSHRLRVRRVRRRTTLQTWE